MLTDLTGPQGRDAEDIVEAALAMTTEDAALLDQCWDPPEGGTDMDAYLSDCKVIWDALEASGRFLPVGWFEARFSHLEWTRDTRALHAVADVVCATLAKDLIPAEVYERITAAWRVFRVAWYAASPLRMK